MRISSNVPQIFNNFPRQAKHAMKPLGAAAQSDVLSISGGGAALAGRLRVPGDGFTAEKNAASRRPEVNMMRRTMSEEERILGKMKEISSAAADANLSTDDRVDLQIRLTKLQAQLYKKTHGMSVEAASKGGSRNFNPNLLNAVDYDERMTIKLLERERARSQSGGAEDVAGVLLLE